MFLYMQFANECVVHPLDNLYDFAFTPAPSALCEQCHAYHIVGERMCRIAFADKYRLAAVLRVELVVAVPVARECAV